MLNHEIKTLLIIDDLQYSRHIKQTEYTSSVNIQSATSLMQDLMYISAVDMSICYYFIYLYPSTYYFYHLQQ